MYLDLAVFLVRALALMTAQFFPLFLSLSLNLSLVVVFLSSVFLLPKFVQGVDFIMSASLSDYFSVQHILMHLEWLFEWEYDFSNMQMFECTSQFIFRVN